MIFEVTEEHIAKLKDDDLRALIGKLCEQELRTQGQSPVAVTWGGHQNAADGGIDVRVDLPKGSAVSGFVPRPASGFQVKAQDMPRQEILDEMRPGGTLRSSITDLAEKGGAYIIVSSQGSVADTPLTERKKAMRDAVGEKLAGSITLEFYDRQRIATWVNHHKGLIPWVLEKVGLPLSGWRAFSDWSSSPTAVDSEYLFDDGLRLRNASLGKGEGVKATDGINVLREILRQPRGVVRLVGLSGVGKTEPESRLSLIKVEYDINDDQPEWTSVFRLEVASIELVEKILEKRFPEIPWPDRSAIAKLSDGNARIAFALASTAKSGESLANLRDSDLFKRLFEQNKGASDSLMRVAKACTLVYSFEGETLDGETPDNEPPHLPVLAALAGVTADEFYANVAELIRRQLVQTRGPWRAFLPHALAHRIAKLAFQDISFGKIEAALVSAERSYLLRSFSRRIGFMHDEPNARTVVSKFFADGGILNEIGQLDNFHQAILTNVAPVDLGATLTFIETAATSKPWFFGPENTNKTLICRLLRSLAYEAAHFDCIGNLLSGELSCCCNSILSHPQARCATAV